MMNYRFLMKKRFSKYLFISVFIIVVAGWIAYKKYVEIGVSIIHDPIHIAFVGPLTGNGAPEGNSLQQGVQLYVDMINEKGGIDGKKIVLDSFDDKNNADLAKAQAKKIVEQNQAIAVIGHYYSSASMSGGEEYKRAEIPAITPSSTNIDVTKNNDWYFRTVFNDKLQGRFLAHYLKKVLNQDEVTIIHEDLPYGSYLAQVFEETAKELDISINYKRRFEVKSPHIERELKGIVKEIKKQEEEEGDIGFIFLATHAHEGVELVKLIKDSDIQNHIIVPAALDAKTFSEGFDNYPREKLSPGYYTDNIYITTPLVLDTANEKAQHFRKEYYGKYGEKADVRAALAYDTAMIIVEAIKNANIEGEKTTLEADRKKIKNYLASINKIDNAIEGVTGFNYFDKNGDAQKSVSIGKFKNKNIISALVQLQDVQNLGEIHDVSNALEEGRLLVIDDKYMYKTNVVYVGVKINEIDEFDSKKLTFKLNGRLWFRFKGDDDVMPQNVEFLNIVDPIYFKNSKNSEPKSDSGYIKESREIELEFPPAALYTKASSSSIATKFRSPLVEVDGDMNYRLYEINDHFKSDFLPGENLLDKHLLGFSFRHRELSRKNLIYVTDVIGMGTEEGESLVDRLKKAHALKHAADWDIDEYRFFQSVAKENSLGNPKYLNAIGGKIEYSQFNVNVRIASNQLTLRKSISTELADVLLLLSGIIIFLVMFASKHPKLKYFSKTIWFFHAAFAVLLLLSSEVILIDWQSNVETSNFKVLERISEIFDVLWWAVPAILLHLAVELFLWLPLEEKSGRKIPRIGRRFVAFTIYLMTILAIVAFVYDQKLTSLLATSGVIAMIIGLAIQINISNIFSGIAINLERPFRVGDWVQLGEFEEGKVIDITWRATRIMTRAGCILSIPNSVASESSIHNFDYPDDSFWLRFIVHIHPAHSPKRVQKIIKDAVMSTDVVLRSPDPFVIFRGISDWAADYLVYCAVRDYTWKLLHEESVWNRIWTHLNRAGIAPAIQRQEVHLFKGIKERGEKVATKPLTILQEIDLFQPFSDEVKACLSERMESHRLTAGEIIFNQGDVGDSLFILVEGVAGVRVKSAEGGSIEVARLGAGNVFGEMALLTGEDRTATVIAISDIYLFEITKESMAPFIEKQPEVSNLLSKILTQRQMQTQSQINVRQVESVEEEVLYKRFRDKIESFFGLGGK